MRAVLKSAKVVAVLLALGWAGFAVYLGTLADYDRIVIEDAYVQVSGKAARSGAAYMVIRNNTQTDDRLIAVSADIARVAELRGNFEGENGVVAMRRIENGIDLPAGVVTVLDRRGAHVVLFGLWHTLSPGDNVNLTLFFETAGEITQKMQVGQER
ncbi:MAG: copper chaperone PCu(A)C [Rhodobacteraceae bacterium]|nr:copper chaperone PCu(A)C [Paracoccaceae bacterium]